MKLSKRNEKILITALSLMLSVLVVTNPSYADLNSSLGNLQSKLTTLVLPTLSIIGVTFAAVSFFSGNPQSKQHIIYAILGCIFGFGATAIVGFISETVR